MGRNQFTDEDARRIGEEVGIDWSAVDFDPATLRQGMEVELEHGSRDPRTNVTNDDPHLTAKIAWAHLEESARYYEALERMEAELEA